MEGQWFYEEAILTGGAEEKVGSSAFFYPRKEDCIYRRYKGD